MKMKIMSTIVFILLVLTSSVLNAGGLTPMVRIDFDVPACVNQTALSEVVQSAMEEGSEELDSAMSEGTCITLKEGEEVYYLDTALCKGYAKVRKSGDTQAYWTVYDAAKLLQ